MPEAHNPLDYFTLELYQEFLCGLTRLQAWYLWWLTQKEKQLFAEVVGTRIYMFPRVYKASNEEWEALEKEMQNLYAAQGSHPDTPALEEWVLEKSLPAIKANAPTLYNNQWVKAFNHALGGFTYNYRREGGGEVAYLHFRNSFIPDSPFAHKEELLAGLKATIQKISGEKPGLQRVLMGSWLNDVKAFVSLFPPGWQEGAIYEKPANHMGWWGQFMDRAGRLHRKNAEKFRKTGKFPFRNIMCESTMSRFKKHFGLP